MKRSHDSWISGAGGGEELSFRRRLNSPGRESVEPSALASLSVSAKQTKVCSFFFLCFFFSICLN